MSCLVTKYLLNWVFQTKGFRLRYIILQIRGAMTNSVDLIIVPRICQALS